MNPSEVSEGLDLQQALEIQAEAVAQAEAPALLEPSPAALAAGPSLLNPPWLRLAYALEFFIAVIAIITAWSEIGGEGHLDLMPWYTKLVCILGLAWCSVRFTASLVEQQRVWTARSLRWFFGILIFCLLMGGITYYYHLHEQTDDSGDDESTAAAVNIQHSGTCFDHGNSGNFYCFSSRFVARSRAFHGHRVPARTVGGDPRVRL